MGKTAGRTKKRPAHGRAQPFEGRYRIDAPGSGLAGRFALGAPVAQPLCLRNGLAAAIVT